VSELRTSCPYTKDSQGSNFEYGNALHKMWLI
jgi:hypothetical protein